MRGQLLGGRSFWGALFSLLISSAAVAEQRDIEAFSLDIVYTAEVTGLASGGVKRGTRYLDNLDIIAKADLERTLGWNGATAFAYGLYNNGVAFNPLVGDAFVTSNLETGVKALRLYEAWIEQKIGKSASLRVGLYDLNSEFDALDAAGLFHSSAHGIGTDISQSGKNGPSIFPVTSLGARLSIRLDDRWSVRAAVLDAVPGNPARPAQTAIKLSNDDGALIVGEIEHRRGEGRFILGHWRYTGAFDRFDGGQSRNNDGLYLRGESRLSREAADPNQGLSGFFRLGLANGAINPFNRFVSGGLNYRGPFKGRDGDQLGLAVAAAFTSRDYRLSTPAKPTEISFEFTYHAPITRWLTIQPDIQYILNPGPTPGTRNALVFGLRAEFTWAVF
jgi:porin